MAVVQEIHIRVTATGAWVVELDNSDSPVSWHENADDAERTALAIAATCPAEPAVVIHDRYDRRHDSLLHT